MMKVLFVVSASTAHGGTEILVFNLMREFQKLDIDCYLISRYIYKGDNPHVINMNNKEFSHYQKLLNNPLNKLLGCKLSDNYFRKVISKTATNLHVDWIVNHTYDLCSAIPMNGAWRTAQVFHWSLEGYEHNLLSSVRQKKLGVRLLYTSSLKLQIARWHRAIPRFNRLVCLTDSAYSEILRTSHLPIQNKIFHIPDPLMQRNESKEVSSLKNKVIVYVGRLSHEKGVMRLLQIWKRVSAKLDDYTLKIYGDGNMRGEMEQYIQSQSLSRVELMGFSSDLKGIYKNADLCLMTSDTEGFGMVLIEAMYYGVPCVSFDCPISPKEIIADAGVVIPCFDVNAYADAVVELLKNTERLQTLQHRSVERAKDFYIDKVISLWLQMLKSND